MQFQIDEIKTIHNALLTTIHFRLMNYNLSLKEQEEIRKLYNVENKISVYLTAKQKELKDETVTKN